MVKNKQISNIGYCVLIIMHNTDVYKRQPPSSKYAFTSLVAYIRLFFQIPNYELSTNDLKEDGKITIQLLYNN